MDSYSILVIIISVLVIILLIISIVITVYILKLVKIIKQLTDKATSVVDSASTIRKFVSPAIVGRAVFEAFQKVAKGHTKDKEER